VLVSVGVDWLTATAKEQTEVDAMRALGSRLLWNQAESGFKVEPWGSHGFVGCRAGEAISAKRGHEHYLRVSGWLAATQWRRVYEVANNITRVDYQCTSRTGVAPFERVGGYWKASARHAGKKGRHQKRTRIQSDTGGYTVYFGSRQSVFFGRIYNKEVESDDPQFRGCVRHELEIHKPAALCFLRELAEAEFARAQVLEIVSEWFAVRAGLLPVELEAARLIRSVPKSSFALKQTHLSRPASDVSKSLEWIRTQVAPTVKWLSAQGYGEAAHRILFDYNQTSPSVDVGHLAQLQIEAMEVM